MQLSCCLYLLQLSIYLLYFLYELSLTSFSSGSEVSLPFYSYIYLLIYFAGNAAFGSTVAQYFPPPAHSTGLNFSPCSYCVAFASSPHVCLELLQVLWFSHCTNLLLHLSEE